MLQQQGTPENQTIEQIHATVKENWMHRQAQDILSTGMHPPAQQ